MKAKYFMLAILFASFSFTSFAKSNTDTIKVAGNCGMCKSNIEKAAKDAGVSAAVWDKSSKLLAVEYDAAKTNNMDIQKKVAAAGYDTQDVKASDKSYNKLDKCCQYDRTAKTDTKASCCQGMDNCSKDGCCKNDMSCCKNDTAEGDCCKDGKCKSGK
jgi:periplasmic mercuric ion binding protein